MRFSSFFFLFLCAPFVGLSQLLGGSNGFNFIQLPNNPQLSALGGINISSRTSDIGLCFNNPALLRADMNGQLQAVFNSLYAGIKSYSLVAGYANEKLRTNFGMGVNYLDYGSLDQTDPSGNILGRFHPRDYLLQLFASRRYEEHWHYGLTIKFMQSKYGSFQSTALAMDAAGSYYDSSRLMQASIVIGNMGVQLQEFVAGNYEQLPFDIQIGLSKRLSKAPIQFSITAHHLYKFDLAYNDTLYNGNPGQKSNLFTVDKVFQHFVFGAQFYIDEKIELSAGYNRLRRTELRVENSANGLTGCSMGLGFISRKLQIRYARSWYQNNIAYNQFGLNVVLF